MQKVEFVSENKAGACPGFVGGNGSKAAVIVLQEWWGVNEQIKKQADEWFGKDFTVMCPDLYQGKVAIDHEEAGYLMNGLDWIGAVQDIAGCVKFLKEKKGCAKVGVVGFCMSR